MLITLIFVNTFAKIELAICREIFCAKENGMALIIRVIKSNIIIPLISPNMHPRKEFNLPKKLFLFNLEMCEIILNKILNKKNSAIKEMMQTI